jgi:hypothetical protein
MGTDPVESGPRPVSTYALGVVCIHDGITTFIKTLMFVSVLENVSPCNLKAHDGGRRPGCCAAEAHEGSYVSHTTHAHCVSVLAGVLGACLRLESSIYAVTRVCV